MPCGPSLIEAVASQLHVQNGIRPVNLQGGISPPPSLRAIRYAIAELVKTGRARRQGNKYGPVYAVVRK